MAGRNGEGSLDALRFIKYISAVRNAERSDEIKINALVIMKLMKVMMNLMLLCGKKGREERRNGSNVPS